MDTHDSQRIKEIRDNTAKMADAFTRIADALERLTDRKTENSSEKPNNCEEHRCYECWWWDYDHGCQNMYKCKYRPLDKDINVRSKDEPQTADCPFDDDAIPCEWVCTEYGKCKYKPKDEPQTDYTPDCPFCKRYGTEDCLGSDCRHYKTYKTEPQTERSE